MSKKELKKGWGFKPHGGSIKFKRSIKKGGPARIVRVKGDPYFEVRRELAIQKLKDSGLPIPLDKARLAIVRFDSERLQLPPMPPPESVKTEFEKISCLAGELSQRLERIRHSRIKNPLPLEPLEKSDQAIRSLIKTLKKWSQACSRVDMSNAPSAGPKENYARKSFIRELRQLYFGATGDAAVTKRFVEAVKDILSTLGAPAQSIEALTKQVRAVKLQ
jgi:hypothetical protein